MAGALAAIRGELRSLAEPGRAPELQRFFKTGPGEYAEGDVLIGVRVGGCRRVAKAHRDLSLAEAVELLGSEIHEERLVALLIMVDAYERRPDSRTAVYDAYLANAASVDNWDLVDVSCRDIVGLHLLERPRAAALRTRRLRAGLGATDRDRLDLRLHPRRRPRRHLRHRRAVARRSARPDSQGDRLDAARGGQA